MVSGQALVLTQSDAFPERLPAASAASTWTWYGVPHVSPVSVTLGDVGELTSRLLR